MKIQSTASSKALTGASLLRSGSKSEVTQQPSVAEDRFEPCGVKKRLDYGVLGNPKFRT